MCLTWSIFSSILDAPKRKASTDFRDEDEDVHEPEIKKHRGGEDAEEGEETSKTAKDKAAPLWNVPYDEQKKLKNEEMRSTLIKMTRKLRREVKNCFLY